VPRSRESADERMNVMEDQASLDEVSCAGITAGLEPYANRDVRTIRTWR
jgi:hypothetical protein